MKHLLISLFILVVGTLHHSSTKAQTTSSNPCGTDIKIQLTSPAANAIVSGDEVKLTARVDPTSGLRKVEFLRSGVVFGSGDSEDDTPNIWSYKWNTRSVSDGDYILYARSYHEAHYEWGSGFTTVCYSSGIKVTVKNGVTEKTPSLSAELTPGYWGGEANKSYEFRTRTYFVGSDGSKQDVTSGATYSWKTSLGTINPNRDQATFSSGNAAGSGTVTVVVTYNNLSVTKNAVVKVYSPVSPATVQVQKPTALVPYVQVMTNELEACLKTAIGEKAFLEISSGKRLPTGRENRVGQNCFGEKKILVPDRYVPASPIQSPELAACLKDKMTPQAYYEINSGQRRPTLEEHSVGKECYATIAQPLIPQFAPIVPEKENVTKLPAEPRSVRVSSAENTITKTAEGTDKPAVLLSGQVRGFPDSIIYIYVFSEPLVFSTKTDSNGNWTYVLSDQLEPGNHEVYVTVEKTPNQFVRSNPLIIEIARAAAGENTAEGISLILAKPDTSLQRSYSVYALALVAVGLIGFALLLKVKRRVSLDQKNITQAVDDSKT